MLLILWCAGTESRVLTWAIERVVVRAVKCVVLKSGKFLVSVMASVLPKMLFVVAALIVEIWYVGIMV